MVDPPGRLVGLDVARCLALLGMVAVHVLPGDGSAGWLDDVHDLTRGRAAALFAVLAGVTTALTTGRQRPTRGRERAAASAGLFVRGLLIALVGLALGHLDSGLAVILTYYGLLFWLALPFLGLGWRGLLVLAAAWTALVPVASHLLRPHLPSGAPQVPTFESLAEPARLLSDLGFTGYYPAVPWLAYLLVGMAIGRMDLTRRGVGAELMAGGAAVAAVAVVVSDRLADPALAGVRQRGTTPTDDWAWLWVRSAHSATPFDLAQTAGCAVAVIGLCVLGLALAGPRVRRGMAVLFGAGALPLSLYSLHVVMRTEPIWPPDHGVDALRWHALVLLAVGALVVALGRRGPLETVVRQASGAARRAVPA